MSLKAALDDLEFISKQKRPPDASPLWGHKLTPEQARWILDYVRKLEAGIDRLRRQLREEFESKERT